MPLHDTSSRASASLFDAYAQVSCTLAANTANGASTSGSFLTYPITTEDFDTANLLAVASNQITLEAGTYWVDGYISLFVPGASGKAKLRNTTDSTDLIVGNAIYSGNTAPNQQTQPRIRGRITLAAQKVLEVQYRVQTGLSVEGLGTQNNFGVSEVYAQVTFWREPA